MGPDKTDEVFHLDKDGKLWMLTGDVAKIDADGFVFILDRLKDMIIRGGENISCAEVEAAIYEHPAVGETAVFGLPDERLGETVAAAVVYKAGVAAPTTKELTDFVS